MVSYPDLVQVARELKSQLNGRAFMTVERFRITEMLRENPGSENTRLKSAISEDLEKALLEQGVRCFPSLRQTTTGDRIRLFHPGTVMASLVDMLAYPSPQSDRELADVTKKVKGEWNWQTTAEAS
jgi:hypothetical protein